MSRIPLHRCANGHEYFYRHARCPACDAPLEEGVVDGAAILAGYTTVRVNPSGKPFRLGLARIASGAATLCLIDDDAGVGDAVTLRVTGDVFHAAVSDNS